MMRTSYHQIDFAARGKQLAISNKCGTRLVSNYRQRVGDSLTAYCLLLTAYCLLLTAYCLLLTAYCLLLTAYCLLLTAYCLLVSVSAIPASKSLPWLFRSSCHKSGRFDRLVHSSVFYSTVRALH